MLYTFIELAKTAGELQDTIAGKEPQVKYDHDNTTVAVFDASGAEIPIVTSFWFAWCGFHPETEVFQGE